MVIHTKGAAVIEIQVEETTVRLYTTNCDDCIVKNTCLERVHGFDSFVSDTCPFRKKKPITEDDVVGEWNNGHLYLYIQQNDGSIDEPFASINVDRLSENYLDIRELLDDLETYIAVHIGSYNQTL